MSTYPLVAAPRQQRSRDSLERVLRAGLQILKEDGFEGFTVQKVSRLAKVSIGSIYARVPSREALILAIYEWTMAWTEQADQQFERAVDEVAGTARERIEAVIWSFADALLTHKEDWAVFVRQAPLHPEILARAHEKTAEYKRRLERSLASAAGSFRHESADDALSFVFSMVFSTITRRISHGAEFDGSGAVSDAALARRLSVAAADYLL